MRIKFTTKYCYNKISLLTTEQYTHISIYENIKKNEVTTEKGET